MTTINVGTKFECKKISEALELCSGGELIILHDEIYNENEYNNEPFHV